MSSWTSADTPSFADSSLLKQSPPFPPHRRADSGAIVADLSLSELYISSHSEAVEDTQDEPFSLLPPRAHKATVLQGDKDEASFLSDCDAQAETSGNGDGITTDKGKQSLNEVRAREERLQRDLFVLKKLNGSFSLYNNALKDARSSTENISMQLERTDRLLNHYVDLLQNTERNSKLIFDETWQGGSNDVAELDRIRAEAASIAQRQREELERKTQLEQERLLKEEQERKIREEAKELSKKSSIPARGVRGTRGRVRTVRDVSESRGRASAIISTAGMPYKRGALGISSRGSSISRGVRRT